MFLKCGDSAQWIESVRLKIILFFSFSRKERNTQYWILIVKAEKHNTPGWSRAGKENKNFLSILLNASIGFVPVVTFHDNHDNQENATYTSGYDNPHDVVLPPCRLEIRGLVLCKIAVSVSERKWTPNMHGLGNYKAVCIIMLILSNYILWTCMKHHCFEIFHYHARC